MTRTEAQKLCGIVSGYGLLDGPSRESVARALKSAFPKLNWRVILDRSGTRTRWSLTVDDNDKREHFVRKGPGERCVHCGKTAKELHVRARDDGDES